MNRKTTQESFFINDIEVSYKLIRSKKRKKSLSLKLLTTGEILVSVPFSIRQYLIEDFIQSKYTWIKAKKELRKQTKSICPLTYINGELHYFLGQRYALEIVFSGKNKVILKGSKLYVFCRKNSSIMNILKTWYKQQALEYLNERTLFLIQQFNFPKINSIKLRFMKARWGSCSNTKNITFNVHLIKATFKQIDYVIIHELCHLIHHNHQKGFYQLQSKCNHKWKLHKLILNKMADSYMNS